MRRRHHIYCIWSSFLFFTSCSGIHKTTLHNFANSVISIIWLALRDDVRSLRLTTMEPLEHFFGQLRTWNREFSAAQIVTFTKKLEIMLDSCIRSDLCTCRAGLKGYQSGFQGFRQSIITMLEKRNITETSKKKSSDDSVDSIKITDNSSAVSQLELAVLSIINCATEDMKMLFSNPSFGSIDQSSFFRHYDAATDLAETYIQFQSRSSNLSNPSVTNLHEKQTVNINEETDPVVSSLQKLQLHQEIEITTNSINDQVIHDHDIVSCNDINVVSLSEIMSDPKLKTLDLSTISRKLLMCLDKSKKKENIGDSCQQVKSLQARWFKKKNKDEIQNDDSIKRNDVVIHSGEYYRVLCVFTKTYN